MQLSILSLLSISSGAAIFILLLIAAIISYDEAERRAGNRMLLLGVLLPLPYILVGLVDFPAKDAIVIVLLALPVLVMLILLAPLGNNLNLEDTPRTRFDERDIMFARRMLKPGTERFDKYYNRHPEKRALDDKWRAKAGLLSPDAVHYNPTLFAAADASFIAVSAFHHTLERDPAERQVSLDPAEISAFIKQWGQKLGAVSVGITPLEDYHVYSHLGRNEPYGEPLEVEHHYAIAFTIEMEKFTVDRAPYAPIVMESAQQYLNAGAIAVQITEFIRNLGYPARAHIDGNYKVICPLVARDAGLGEIGRMGLLMTPELGPRVRLAVVTTDLPMMPDERRRDPTMLDFCEKCLKCAEVCPSNSISFDGREEIGGAMRWQINAESCFTFWSTVGTDCGRCMSVCPYSHPDNALHNVVRWGTRQSPLFRTAAVKLDDFFYGEKPASLPVDGWLGIQESSSK